MASVWFTGGSSAVRAPVAVVHCGMRDGKRVLPGLCYDASVSFKSLGPDSGSLLFGPLSSVVKHDFTSNWLRYWHDEASLETAPLLQRRGEGSACVRTPCCAVMGSVRHGAPRTVPATAERRQST